jgi:hypothetical protein
MISYEIRTDRFIRDPRIFPTIPAPSSLSSFSALSFRSNIGRTLGHPTFLGSSRRWLWPIKPIPRAGQPEPRSRSGRMDKNVSASFTLSLLVVTFFAVALYQPDSRLQSPTARTKRSPNAKPVEDQVPTGPLRQPDLSAPLAPQPTKPDTNVALARSRSAGISQVQVTRHVDPPPAPAVEARKVIASRDEPTRPSQGPPTPSITEPRGAFTSVRPGETLPDVARRVYGPGGDAERLWKANRDLIEKQDSPLPPGTMLRTP